MKKSFWLIEGYGSFDKFYETKIPVGCMTEKQMISTLKCLTAKAGLNYNEIVSSNAKKRTKLSSSHLDVRRSKPYPEFFCGDNPHFSAKVIRE